MIRNLTLAALAAALVAGPASAQSIRISTVGKSPEQLHAEITAAAYKLCARSIGAATFPQDEIAACAKASIADAVAQARNPALATVAQLQLARR